MREKLINDKWQNVTVNFEDNHFDWVIADPPYFKGPEKSHFYGNKKSSSGVERLCGSIDAWDIPTIENYKELCRISKNQIIWGINYFEEFNHIVGSGRLIWDKKNTSSTFSNCEIASVSSIKSVKLFSFMWNGMITQTKINKKRIHPTEKPCELYMWMYESFVKKGETVFDPYGGSMSSVIAADMCNVDIIAVEADKAMFDKAVQRIKTRRSQLKLF